MIERIAKITDTFLGWEGHGIFTVILTLDYGGSCQGAGAYALDEPTGLRGERFKCKGTAYGHDWIMRTMQACGVDEWSRVKGCTVIALFENDSYNDPVAGIKPLPTESGRQFIFKELREEHARLI